MKKITIISAVFLFLAGCGYYTLGGDNNLLSLDEALAAIDTNEAHWADEAYESGRLYYHYRDEDRSLYLRELRHLRRQATSGEDKARIDRKMAEYRQRAVAYKKAYEQQEERKRLEREQLAEQIEKEKKDRFEAWKADWSKFIENAPGSLKDMWAPEVKKLVDNWRKGYQDYEENDRAKFFSIENFYKVFGKPERITLVENASLFLGFIPQDSYYLYYNCKNGWVQIKVNTGDFDHGIVDIQGLNVF